MLSAGMCRYPAHSLAAQPRFAIDHEWFDLVTISQRLGHARPSVTLAVFAHMFHTDDRKAAVAINRRWALAPFKRNETATVQTGDMAKSGGNMWQIGVFVPFCSPGSPVSY